MRLLKLNTIPNFLTIFRLLLVVPLLYFLLNQQYLYGFYVFFIAGFSDALDGFLARRFQWSSRFGAIFDPVADKLMMLVTYFCLTWRGHLPVWLFATVVGRDVWLVLGVIAYRWYTGSWDVQPSRISKLNTLLQVLLAIVLLCHLSLFSISGLIREGLIYLVLITTVASFLDYTLVWGRKAWQFDKREIQ